MPIPYTKHPPHTLVVNDDGTFPVQAGDSLSKYNWAINGNWGNPTAWDLFRRPGAGPDGQLIRPQSLLRTGETLLYLPDYKKPVIAPPTPAPAPTTRRPLTSGEIHLLRSVFGNQITYGSVQIYDQKWMPFQPPGCTMTPNGSMYWNPGDYEPDFSSANVIKRAWFIHEGAHLYEYYGLGWNVIGRGIWDRNYDYVLVPAKTQLKDYGLEEMGDIARDYYYLTQGYPRIVRPTPAPASTYVMADYATLLPLP